jgi:hypothetical protein
VTGRSPAVEFRQAPASSRQPRGCHEPHTDLNDARPKCTAHMPKPDGYRVHETSTAPTIPVPRQASYPWRRGLSNQETSSGLLATAGERTGIVFGMARHPVRLGALTSGLEEPALTAWTRSSRRPILFAASAGCLRITRKNCWRMAYPEWIYRGQKAFGDQLRRAELLHSQGARQKSANLLTVSSILS